VGRSDSSSRGAARGRTTRPRDLEPIFNRTEDLPPSIDLEATDPLLALRRDYVPDGLSKRQLLLWLQQTIHPSTSTLENVLRVELPTRLEPLQFVRAFERAVRATPALRLVIDSSSATPVPSVRHEIQPCEIIDDLPRRRWDAWVTMQAATPLPLESHAYASTLFLDDDTSLWAFRVHRIVADARSLRPFANRVARAYAAKEPTLDDAFATFLEDERLYRGSRDADLDATFWARRLEPTREPLTFYGTTPRRDRLTVRRRTVTLGAEEVLELASRSPTLEHPTLLARTSSSIPILATVTIAFLSRLANQERIGLGVPIDVRSKDGVGPMTEICPIEATVEPDETFASLLKKVQRDLTETTPRARHSIDNRYGNLAYDAVLQVLDLRLTSWGGARPAASIAPALLDHRSSTASGGRHFASLAIQVVRRGGGGLDLELDFAADAFPGPRIDGAPGHFLAALRAFLTNPEQRIQDVDLLTPEERVAMAPRLSPSVPLPSRGVARSVRARAVLHPHRVAVEADGDSVDYATLVRRAEELASYLEGQGVDPGSLVGICLDRSVDLPVAMLATVFAQAGFVPIDPLHPRERVARILEHAAPAVVVTESRFVKSLDAPAETSIVCIDREREAIAAATRTRPARTPASTQIAYVIYTSGSTGTPKGVAVEHGALSNLLEAMAQHPGMTEQDSLLAVTTTTFDISILELFLPLCVGGRLVISSYTGAHDPLALATSIQENGITVMQATPATWRAMLEAGWTGHEDLKVLCGGEPMPPDLARALVDRCGRVFNLYGPTEATIWVTAHEVDGRDGERVSIGRPIANTELYVATEAGTLVPDGLVGELWIGGANLARGYLGREEESRDKFVEHPFDPGRRAYRTGDLARRRVDGTYECLGRRDDQVKVRGFRIELGEIEVALRAHVDVQDCAAVVHADEAGDARIFAYVVAREGAPEAFVADLRATLAQALPAYMIPSHFVPIDHIPLTPNGKVDRRALTPPRPDERAAATRLVRPRNDLEVRLATLWRDILGLAEIGVTDGFFDLGGHSLHAVSMLMTARERFGASVSISSFFEHPTVEALAKKLKTSDGAVVATSVLPLERGGAGAPVFCICGLHLYQDLARAFRAKRPVFGVLSAAEVAFLTRADAEELPSVEQLAADYTRAIVEAAPAGPVVVCGVSFGGVLAFEVARLLRASGRSVERAVLLDAVLGRASPAGLARRLKKRLRGVLAPKRPVDAVERLDAARTEAFDERTLRYEATDPTYDGDVLVIRAAQRDYAPHLEDDLGWRARVRGRFDVCRSPGTHLGMLKDDNAVRLAEAIERHLL
jgi:amino acid adenylation domain-containing protein